MPQTLDRTFHGQIIAGTFSDRENADRAVDAFLDMGIDRSDIQLVVQFTGSPAENIYRDILTNRGTSESQARVYDEAIRAGKVLVVVYNVMDPAGVIDIFDYYGADYNPDGARNVRDDVLGMTTGALVGAAAGGAVGSLVAGPIGGAAGAAAGAVIGGGSGAAVGITSEHKK